MVRCNATLSETHWDVDPVVGNLSLHTLGWLICAACALIATSISLFLIFQHAVHYTRPGEQKHIIRILLMIPIYAITSWLSYVWYWHAIYWEVARDCYEAFAIASFFALLCAYIAPDLRGQKDFFATMDVHPWPWPITWVNKCMKKRQIRKPRSGLTWFNFIWMGVFQYIFVRVSTTIIATATQATGKYCEDSLHPAFAHLWCMLFNIVAVTIAMYCLIAFYLNLRKDLAVNRPFFKLLCIKLVIFFSFWQMIMLDLLSSTNVIKPTQHISQGDISVGFNSMLICFEMIIFAIMHLWAFSYKGFDLGPNRKTPAFRGILDALNPWDTVRATGRGLKWMLWGWRKRHGDVEKIISRKKAEGQGLVGGAAPMGDVDSRPLPGGLQVHHPSPFDATELHSPTEYSGHAIEAVDTTEYASIDRQYSSGLPHHPEPTRVSNSPPPPRVTTPPREPLLPYPESPRYMPSMPAQNKASYSRPRPRPAMPQQPSVESLLDDQSDPSFRYTPSIAGSEQIYQGYARPGMQRNAEGQWGNNTRPSRKPRGGGSN